MLVPAVAVVGVGTLVVLAVRKVTNPSNGKGMTPQKRELYEGALDSLNDPASLRDLAKTLEKEGCKPEAFVLSKLAEYLELPEEQKAKHRELFKLAMASQDHDKVVHCAKLFEGMGAIHAARDLWRYSDTLKKIEQA